MGRKSKAKFELKGHTLPGINQKSEASNLKDGKSPSSAFQMQSPIKQTTTPSYKGVEINPAASYAYKSAKIPSFRDMVSLEQQQAARKAWKAKRAKRKQDKQDKQDKHFADKKLIEDAKKGKFTDQVETVDTTEGQENTTPIIPRDINIVTDGEVTGSTSTSSIPDLEDYEAGSVDDLNEGGFNIDRSNSLY